MKNLKVEIFKIKGVCPVYSEKDSFMILEGYKLKTEKQICLHSLVSLIPYYIAFSRGISPKDLGLNTRDENIAYVQCLDPCEYTGGGTVIFSIKIGV